MKRKLLLMTIFASTLLLLGCQGNLPEDPNDPGSQQEGNLAGEVYEQGQVPTGYAPPWDIFNSNNPYTFSIDTQTSDSTATLDISADSTAGGHGGVVWKNFYVYENGDWQEYSFDQETISDSNWISESATATLTMSESELDSRADENQMVVSFICHQVEGDWKCGCKSSNDCGYWDAQNYLPEFNEPPSVSVGGPYSVRVGSTLSFQGDASDPNGDSLNFTVGAPSGVSGLDILRAGNTITINWTPSTPDVGNYTFTFEAEDPDGASDEESASVEVMREPNDPPGIDLGGAPSSVTAGESYAFQVNASDPDGDSLSMSYSTPSVTGNVSGSVVGNGVQFSFEPVEADVGNHTFSITADDGRASTTAQFEVEVLSGLPGTSPEGPTVPEDNESEGGGTGGSPTPP